ncbi:hypothetical protein IW261DRAFT_257688 [Armillaria novae-zelandiae]|uniref:Secreted protein n=1 Tax=Armillaria novae-zelandiae TaxID=153914 RepID=A0AA39P5H7_9AGAR|nr:hypothetical protein IW261DRAFT_257688 [Armillaria novae-zelandiae]
MPIIGAFTLRVLVNILQVFGVSLSEIKECACYAVDSQCKFFVYLLYAVCSVTLRGRVSRMQRHAISKWVLRCCLVPFQVPDSFVRAIIDFAIHVLCFVYLFT